MITPNKKLTLSDKYSSDTSQIDLQIRTLPTITKNSNMKDLSMPFLVGFFMNNYFVVLTYEFS